MLKSIALPDVTEIEGKAFSGCTRLQKVVLGNLTKVYGNVGKNGIFEGCRTEDIDLVLSKDQKPKVGIVGLLILLKNIVVVTNIMEEYSSIMTSSLLHVIIQFHNKYRLFNS